jgi:hypothetical protein
MSWRPTWRLLLATVGPFAGSAGRLAFLHDVEVHVRFLIALPALLAAELIVNSRLTPIVHRFVERHIVLPEDFPRFNSAVESAMRLRNSLAAEVVVLACSYAFGLWLWHDRAIVSIQTWYASAGGRWGLTPAGIWYVFVSIPIIQFILLRWYMRFFIWFRFLWRVSRLKLNLIPSHPDRCAGLSFLGKTSYAFGPILFAQGAMLTGVVATRVLYRGESLVSFKLQIGAFVAFFVVAILAPLLMRGHHAHHQGSILTALTDVLESEAGRAQFTVINNRLLLVCFFLGVVFFPDTGCAQFTDAHSYDNGP